MNTTLLDKKRRLTLPEPICEAAGLKPNDKVEWRFEAGERRGRNLVPKRSRQPFPRGSLTKYLTRRRDQDQLAILQDCVQGPIE